MFKDFSISRLGRYRVLYLLSALELLVIEVWPLLTESGIAYFRDTISYYEAYNSLLSGKVDIFRTPLYPLFIGVSRTVFGPALSVAFVSVVQSVLFILSIKWIGSTLENITRHKTVGYWFTAVYALYPGVLSYCGMLMTESLAISLVSAFLYLTSEAYLRNSWKPAAMSGITSILLWMLRPSLITIPVLAAFLWGAIMLFGRRKMLRTARWGFLTASLSLATLCGYSMVFNSEYDYFGMSAVPTWNNYMTLRQAKVMENHENDSIDEEIIPDSLTMTADPVDIQIKDTWWNEAALLHCELGPEQFHKFVSDQMKKHMIEVIRHIYIYRIDEMLDADCVFIGTDLPLKLCALTRMIHVNNGTALLIFLLGLLLSGYFNIKGRKITYFTWLLYAMFAANYFTVLVGAPNDFTRLLAQNYPVLIAISCLVLDQLTSIATERYLDKP